MPYYVGGKFGGDYSSHLSFEAERFEYVRYEFAGSTSRNGIIRKFVRGDHVLRECFLPVSPT